MHESIDDMYKGYKEVNGFIYCAVTNPANVFDGLVIRNPENAHSTYPRRGFSSRTLEEHIELVNQENIEKAFIFADDLRFLHRCRGLKYLTIVPSNAAGPEFDFTPLYHYQGILSLSCRNQYGEKDQFNSDIDFSNISELIDLQLAANKRTLNFNKLKYLQSLYISHFKSADHDISDLFSAEELDTLTIVHSNIRNLKGIDISTKLQCLYLHYNRSLIDISEIVKAKNTVRLLRIENCSSIEDYSCIGELNNLELLELTGSSTLPNLDFIKGLKNLKTFLFNMNIINGDLMPCLQLSYAASIKDRRHFNLKNTDLPKGMFIRGNEDIEEWRRLEY